jgi:hypothetical protein
MTIDTIHADLIRANLVAPLDTEETLLWMTLVHTHAIRLTAPLLTDRPGVIELAAVTERHAAEMAARLWEGRRASNATGFDWHRRYHEDARYQSVDDVPAEHRRRLEELRERLATDPRVAAVTPED